MTMTETVHAPFPLPMGHMFGVSLSGDLRFHDPRYNIREAAYLRDWQTRYRSMWWSGLDVTGRYDGPTQRAAVAVQKAASLPVTGWVDWATWDAVWTSQRPVRPPEDPTPAKPKRISKEQWDYWRKTSAYDITYGKDENDPPWYPGRPFGRHERGWHVRELQNLLSLKPTGCFNEDTERRVRGWQRMHGLPASGVVDSPTARHIDPQPQQ